MRLPLAILAAALIGVSGCAKTIPQSQLRVRSYPETVRFGNWGFIMAGADENGNPEFIEFSDGTPITCTIDSSGTLDSTCGIQVAMDASLDSQK